MTASDVTICYKLLHPGKAFLVCSDYILPKEKDSDH